MPRRRVDRLAAALSGAVAARGRRTALAAGLGCLSLVGGAGAAGETDAPPVQRRLALEPSASVTQTFSDNHDLRAVSPQADAITRLTAGIGFRGTTGALRGYLDYSLSSLLYARHSDRNSLQNALNANLAANLVDDRLQVVTAANISRSAISAFGVQPGGAASANNNTTEVRTLKVSPTLRGPLGPGLRYTATLDHAISDASDGGLGDSTTTTANLHLEPTERARLGWSVDATHLTSDFKLGRSTQSDRLFGGLQYDLDALDLLLNASGGLERNNQISLDNRSYRTWGVGLVWAPSPVTRVSADLQHRFFGRSHSVSIEHRTPRTVFRLRSGRTLSTSGTQAAGLRGPAFALFDGLLSSNKLLDQAQREQEVLRQLSLLGITDPNQIISTGFLQSGATLQDLHELSAAWTGQRNSALLVLSRSATRRVEVLSAVIGDLANTREVKLSGLSLNLSHRLTPLSSLALSMLVQRSSGSTALQSNRQAQADLLLTTRLSPDSTASVSLRHAKYKTASRPYDETAVSATYGIRF